MIKIFIEDVARDLTGSLGDIIDIYELDFVSFQMNLEGSLPKIYIEDYEVVIERKNNYFISEKYQFFRESFGLSCVRIYCGDQVFEYTFNVLAEKVTCDKATSIIEYVYKNNPNLLKVNFSRTSVEKSLIKDESTHFESFLDFSQSLINYLDSKKIILSKLVKKKFIIQKSVIGNHVNKQINPEEVICNIDKLYQDNTSSEIIINRNYYSSDGLEYDSLNETYDFSDNQAILSGLIYTRLNLSKILDIIDGINLNEISNSDKEYSSFKKNHHYRKDISKIILKVTSGGILKRVLFLLKEIEYYIHFFKNKLKISYNGPIYPRLSKITSNHPFYKDVFNKIRYIYECGSFGLSDVIAKIKIRSMSKIYEFFCLYKLVEVFEKIGFTLISEIKDGDIPKEIVMNKGDKFIHLYYEKIIDYIDNLPTNTSGLVSVDYEHSKRDKYNYYNPDFVILIKDANKNHGSYYIFDAKFRRIENLKKDQVLKEIKYKYFDNIRYLDCDKKTLSNKNILGNFILYQGDKNLSLYENIHLKDFISLPLFEIISLNESLDDSFIEKLISYTE